MHDLFAEFLWVSTGALFGAVTVWFVMNRNSERVVSGLRDVIQLGLGDIDFWRDEVKEWMEMYERAANERDMLRDQTSFMSNEIKHLPRRAANGRMEKR